MKEFMKKLRKHSHVTDARVVVAIIGLFLSVALHELFHILLHWGNVTTINFFADKHTIMQEVVVVPNGYNVGLEEAAAYGITMIVMLLTIIAVWKIHDVKSIKNDVKTSDMSELIEFAYKNGFLKI
jgi:hypothetical protein